jgi:hypothetical protein
MDISRRDALRIGGTAVALAVTGPQLVGSPAEAQTPKRGGTLRLSVSRRIRSTSTRTRPSPSSRCVRCRWPTAVF